MCCVLGLFIEFIKKKFDLVTKVLKKKLLYEARPNTIKIDNLSVFPNIFMIIIMLNLTTLSVASSIIAHRFILDSPIATLFAFGIIIGLSYMLINQISFISEEFLERLGTILVYIFIDVTAILYIIFSDKFGLSRDVLSNLVSSKLGELSQITIAFDKLNILTIICVVFFGYFLIRIFNKKYSFSNGIIIYNIAKKAFGSIALAAFISFFILGISQSDIYTVFLFLMVVPVIIYFFYFKSTYKSLNRKTWFMLSILVLFNGYIIYTNKNYVSLILETNTSTVVYLFFILKSLFFAYTLSVYYNSFLSKLLKIDKLRICKLEDLSIGKIVRLEGKIVTLIANSQINSLTKFSFFGLISHEINSSGDKKFAIKIKQEYIILEDYELKTRFFLDSNIQNLKEGDVIDIFGIYREIEITKEKSLDRYVYPIYFKVLKPAQFNKLLLQD